jgi:hypothetical protein
MEHFYEAFYHIVITWFPYPTTVFRIELGEYVTTAVGLNRKLYEERWKQVAKVLFIGVPEVEIKIGHQGRSSIVQSLDILYDRGARLIMSVLQQYDVKVRRTKAQFSLNQL